MATRQKGTRLGDYFLEHRRTKPTFLDEIDQLIDWRPIDVFLRKKIKRKANAVGNPAYPALAMFKILLLQRWYNLKHYPTYHAVLLVEGTALDRNSVSDPKLPHNILKTNGLA